MTFQEIYQAAKGGYGLAEAADDSALADAQWKRAVNKGYRWLARYARLIPGQWTITSVDGTREYSLAGRSPGIAQVSLVLFKRGGTRWAPLPLLGGADQAARAICDFHDRTGAPGAYYARGGSLGFDLIPDAANAGAFIEVWGFAFPAALVNNSDTPEIEASLHDYLLAPAKYEMAAQELAAGRSDAAALVALYEQERQTALTECREYVAMLSDEPQFVNWSLDEEFQ